MLAGCSGIELDAVNPPGMRLSGEWILDFGASDDVPDLRQHRPGKMPGRGGPPGDENFRARPAGRDLPFVVHDFQVLKADKMVIELNHDSMGVRYYPGVYRDLTWGKRQRGLWEVYAGWDLQVLRVLSEANDIEVDERFILQGDRLTVDVHIVADDDEFRFQRVFKRVK